MMVIYLEHQGCGVFCLVYVLWLSVFLFLPSRPWLVVMVREVARGGGGGGRGVGCLEALCTGKRVKRSNE